MNPIKVLEWKGMYPIKKNTTCNDMAVRMLFMCGRNHLLFISDNDIVKDNLIGLEYSFWK